MVGLEAGRGAEVGSWDRIPESPPIYRTAVFYANSRNLAPDLSCSHATEGRNVVKKQVKKSAKTTIEIELRDLIGSTYLVSVSHSNTRSLRAVFEQKIRRLASRNICLTDAWKPNGAAPSGKLLRAYPYHSHF